MRLRPTKSRFLKTTVIRMDLPEAKNRPSNAAIFERACSLARDALFTVELQRRRVGSSEPEDEVFLFRWWADLQFFTVALRRLRRAAELARQVPSVATHVSAALTKFDAAIPMLSVMRNVGEHIDDYALDNPKRRHRQVDRRALQVGEWDGVNYRWLGEHLNIDESCAAAKELYSSVCAASEHLSKTST